MGKSKRLHKTVEGLPNLVSYKTPVGDKCEQNYRIEYNGKMKTRLNKTGEGLPNFVLYKTSVNDKCEQTG